MRILMSKNNSRPLLLISIVLLFSIAATIVPSDMLDSTDVKDYSDTAKFFAGEYSAKHRSAHSLLYGMMLSPYVKVSDNFFIIKLSSALFLSLLILSVYYISGKDLKTLWLFVLSPIIWYMSPLVSPIPLATLLFLWAYYFVKKFNSEEKLRYFIYSGLLVGLASAFWDTALYLSFIFLVSFFYNKKFYYSWIFAVFLAVGLIPRLIADQLLFNFAFYSIIKHASAVFAFTLFGGIYESGFRSMYILSLIIFILFIPVYTYLFYKKDNFLKYSGEVVFFSLFILFVISNPQPRFLLFITPISALVLGKIISRKQFKIQFILFLIISTLVIAPYIIQTKYETNWSRFDEAVRNINELSILTDSNEIIRSDLERITEEFPEKVFLVGNKNDNYRRLAHLYWGENIEEFVSIEDYNLFLEGNDNIASKKISSDSDYRFRREIWIEIGLQKNSNDITDYANIEYGVGLGEPIEAEGFEVVKEYDFLYLSKKA